tara:strand:+ start:179 stop:538 length:360 start_codon:yes stop_codon:yes gene_type:complete
MKNLIFIVSNNSIKNELTDIRESLGVTTISDVVLELCNDFWLNPYNNDTLMSNAEVNFKTVNAYHGGKWLCAKGNKSDKPFSVYLNKKVCNNFSKISKKVGLKTGMLLSYLIDSYYLER